LQGERFMHQGDSHSFLVDHLISSSKFNTPPRTPPQQPLPHNKRCIPSILHISLLSWLTINSEVFKRRLTSLAAVPVIAGMKDPCYLAKRLGILLFQQVEDFVRSRRDQTCH
jgi:hypothetical protein